MEKTIDCSHGLALYLSQAKKVVKEYGEIYKLRNRSTGKDYVGQTPDFDVRLPQHKSSATHGTTQIATALRDYDIDNFDKEILMRCKRHQLDFYEDLCIHIYNTRVPYGYNVQRGCKGLYVNQETLCVDIVKPRLNCEFCGKEFKNKTNLNVHLRTAKYCLKLRGEEAAPGDTYACDGCEREFTTKTHLTKHKKSCRVDVSNLTKIIRESSDSVIAEKDKQLLDKDRQLLDKDRQLLDQDKQLLDLRFENEVLKGQLKIYKEQVEANQEILAGLADRPTTSTHTMHQHIGEVNQQVLSLERTACNIPNLTALVDDLEFDVIRNGQKGIAKAVHTKMFTTADGKTKMLCTDAARDVFKHLDENGKICKDNKLTKLVCMVYEAGLEDKIDEFREKIPLLTTNASEREILHKLAAECLQMKHDSVDFRTSMRELCDCVGAL